MAPASGEAFPDTATEEIESDLSIKRRTSNTFSSNIPHATYEKNHDLHGSPSPKKSRKASGQKENQKQGFLSKMATKASRWTKVSEPSGNALDQYRKAEFRRSNVTGLEDPQAAAKLKIPSTKLPDDAIKPSGKGPEPEEILRKNRLSKAKATGSSSSGSSKAPSMKSSIVPPSTGTSSRTNPGSITEESLRDFGSPSSSRKPWPGNDT